MEQLRKDKNELQQRTAKAEALLEVIRVQLAEAQQREAEAQQREAEAQAKLRELEHQVALLTGDLASERVTVRQLREELGGGSSAALP